MMLSFDVEDWFHSHNLRAGIDRDRWDEYELRVQYGTRRILELLDDHDTRATFFVLGHVAERAPELVKEIDDRGHEIACHGYNHELLYEQTPAEVHADVQRSLRILEGLVDQPVDGYRAPSFSITDRTTEILRELGFSYDSSNLMATAHDRYGGVDVTSDDAITRTRDGLVEVQLPLYESRIGRVPWAGGGYFRVLPYRLYRRGVETISNTQDFVFYLHPWELDPGQPRVREPALPYRLRHYANLERTERKLDRLLADFEWEPIRTCIERTDIEPQTLDH